MNINGDEIGKRAVMYLREQFFKDLNTHLITFLGRNLNAQFSLNLEQFE